MLSFFRHLRFRHQILALMLSIVLANVLLSMFVARPYMLAAHRDLAFERLESIAMTKAGWMGEMLDRMSKDALAGAVNELTIESTRAFSDILNRMEKQDPDAQTLSSLRNAYVEQDSAPDASGRYRGSRNPKFREYDDVRRRVWRVFRMGRLSYDYTDTLIVEAKTGRVLYSSANNVDLLASLKDEPYVANNTGRVFQHALERAERMRSFGSGNSQGGPGSEARSGRDLGRGRGSQRSEANSSPQLGSRPTSAPVGEGLGGPPRFRDPASSSSLPPRVRFGDFEFSSNGEDIPTACIGTAIVDMGQDGVKTNTEILGVLINRVSVDPFDRIMLQQEGLGQTGETFLVGPDKLMRSNSRLFGDPAVLRQEVDTLAAREALAGKKGSGIIKNHHGIDVLSVWFPVDIFGETWALIAEQEKSEAYEILNTNITRMAWMWTLFTIGLAFMAYWFSRQIDRPLGLLVHRARALAANEQIKNAKEPVSGREIIELVGSFDEMAQKVIERDAMKDEFLHIASHDLKNPLTTVLSASRVIQDLLPPGSVQAEQTLELAGRINSSARGMQRIIEDFLDFQAMEDGQIKVEKRVLDLKRLGQEVVGENSQYAQGKEIRLTFEVSEDLPDVKGDLARIEQVAQNLVGNAIKFCPKNGAVTVQARSEGNTVIFEVSDTGPGLDEEDMGKLFTKYARLKNKPTGGEKSSGLGLAISRKLIDLQGGEIGARNNAGAGATFWFRLPIG